MWCIQTPGKLNWSSAHPSLSPNVDQFTNFVTIFWVLWICQRVFVYSMSTMALLWWYKHRLYISCDVFQHWDHKIVASHLLFYLQIYLCLAFSVPEYFLLIRSRVNILFLAASGPRHFLNNTSIFYILNMIYLKTWKKFKWCSSFLPQNVWVFLWHLDWSMGFCMQYKYNGISWVIHTSLHISWNVFQHLDNKIVASLHFFKSKNIYF